MGSKADNPLAPPTKVFDCCWSGPRALRRETEGAYTRRMTVIDAAQGFGAIRDVFGDIRECRLDRTFFRSKLKKLRSIDGVETRFGHGRRLQTDALHPAQGAKRSHSLVCKLNSIQVATRRACFSFPS